MASTEGALKRGPCHFADLPGKSQQPATPQLANLICIISSMPQHHTLRRRSVEEEVAEQFPNCLHVLLAL